MINSLCIRLFTNMQVELTLTTFFFVITIGQVKDKANGRKASIVEVKKAIQQIIPLI